MKGRVKFASPLVLGRPSSYFGGIIGIQVLPGGLLGVCVGAPRLGAAAFRNDWRGRKPWALCRVFADSKISGLTFPKLT